MATVILLRHGRSSANSAGVLAGRSPKVGLDARGLDQANSVVQRLGDVPLAGLVSSPLQRCRQTVAPLATARDLRVTVESGLSEVDYGEWTGRELKTLAKEPLWRVVQSHPSAAVFPDGERLATVQARAVAAIRAHDARITAEHGPESVWLACSHADVIKSVLADALGLHLDSFQRIVVDPCSISVIRYTDTRPFVLRSNDNGGDLAGVVPPKPKQRKRSKRTDRASSSDAIVGGGAD